MAKLLILCGLLALSCGVLSHTYHTGACPVVEPMAGFDMNRMLGLWYVIRKTSTASSCIAYNFTRSTEPGHFQLEQVSQHFLLGLTPLKHDYRYTGELTVPDPAVPAKMKVRFPLSVAGSASYTVLSTDYSTYAAIFTCQRLAFAHRQSAVILSRGKELDKMYLDKMISKLSSFGIDPFAMSVVSQSMCPAPTDTEGYSIDIDPQTFSSKNIGDAVRKTGGYIAEGVEYVVEAGKKVYHRLAGDDREPTTAAAAHAGRTYQTQPPPQYGDAEWLP